VPRAARLSGASLRCADCEATKQPVTAQENESSVTTPCLEIATVTVTDISARCPDSKENIRIDEEGFSAALDEIAAASSSDAAAEVLERLILRATPTQELLEQEEEWEPALGLQATLAEPGSRLSDLASKLRDFWSRLHEGGGEADRPNLALEPVAKLEQESVPYIYADTDDIDMLDNTYAGCNVVVAPDRDCTSSGTLASHCREEHAHFQELASADVSEQTLSSICDDSHAVSTVVNGSGSSSKTFLTSLLMRARERAEKAATVQTTTVSADRAADDEDDEEGESEESADVEACAGNVLDAVESDSNSDDAQLPSDISTTSRRAPPSVTDGFSTTSPHTMYPFSAGYPYVPPAMGGAQSTTGHPLVWPTSPTAWNVPQGLPHLLHCHPPTFPWAAMRPAFPGASGLPGEARPWL